MSNDDFSDELARYYLCKESLEERAKAALAVVFAYGQYDGAHHKQWVLDRVVRALTGPSYDAAIAKWKHGDDGPETYAWDEGIAP